MILVQTFMGIIIVAIVYTVGKQLWKDIKSDIKKRWLFNAKKISFAHDKIDDVKEWGEIDKLLKTGVRITPMKLYMEKFNCNLKTAKDAIDERYIEVNNVIPPALTISFNCRKCSQWDNVEHIRVRGVTLEEHGISKPYKGVYQCTQCGNEVILDNEDEV